ncbi:nuclear transport factor 2 family protein [Candidatus Entotheonella serta]|nr:nuclear transport factor 2 family protein [Candidatus Entotheonella serta]
MPTDTHVISIKRLLDSLQQAMNNQDVDAFLLCFQDTYASEQPAHPGRDFRGHEQVRKNWEAIFNGVPNFHAELIRYTPTNDMVWTEWHWSGTRIDGSAFEMRGVFLWGVEAGLMTWGRSYMEHVEPDEFGIAGMINAITNDS